MTQRMTLFERFWHFLPDRCEMPECKKTGIRGNESNVDGKIMCDDCEARYTHELNMRASRKYREAHE